MDFATAKTVLQKKEGSASVYDHLTNVILKIVEASPANAFAAFEQISAGLKAGTYSEAGPSARAGGEAAASDLSSHHLSRLAAQLSLLRAPGAEDEEGNAPAGSGDGVQDLVEESFYLEWAGFGLGRTEMYRLSQSLRHLSFKYPVRNLRLFGKILGLKSDYLVAEGEMDADTPEEELSAVLEGAAEAGKDALGSTLQPMGTGPNRHVYFVCSGVGEQWIRLPHVTPHQIVVARKIRKYLTGDLEAPVDGHPPFPGKEKNYLRALIALIAAGTVVVPSGMYQAVDGDEEGNIEPAEEFEGGDLSQLDAWVHERLALNVLGRTRPNPPTVGEDGEEVADPEAPEPSAPLAGISEDPAVDEAAEEGGGAWDIRKVPVGGTAEGEEPQTGITVLRSLRFPGAVTVGFQKKRFVNVYCGYGLEVSTSAFQPQLPFSCPAEYDFSGEETKVQEKPDVKTDPTPPKPEGEEGAEAEEE